MTRKKKRRGGRVVEIIRQNFLTEEKIQENLKRFYTCIERIKKNYEHGLYTREEVRNQMSMTLYGSFYSFIDGVGLRLKFVEDNWENFLCDYNNPNQIVETLENEIPSWLHTGEWNEEKQLWISASTYDKRLVIRLMQEFHLTPEYFLPMPKKILIPRIISAHTWATCSYAIIDFCKVDEDSGYFDCDNPCGKTFMFRDELGLKSKIKIVESFSPPNKLVKANVIYRGEGYIEGYTQINDNREYKDIYIIEGSNKKVLLLMTRLSHEDSQTHYKFEMWQDYYKWREDSTKRREKIEEKFLKGL